MVTLRPATEFDLEYIIYLRNQGDTYKRFYSGKKFTFHETLEWFRSRDPETNRIYMAVEDDLLVGTCSIYDIKEGCAEVGRIMVNELMRGQGLGARILCAATDEAKELGLEELHAHIMPDNVASQKAFLKAGYQANEDKTFVWLKIVRD